MAVLHDMAASMQYFHSSGVLRSLVAQLLRRGIKGRVLM